MHYIFSCLIFIIASIYSAIAWADLLPLPPKPSSSVAPYLAGVVALGILIAIVMFVRKRKR